MERYNHATIGMILSSIAVGIIWGSFVELSYKMGMYPVHGWESIGTWFFVAGLFALALMGRLLATDNPYREQEVLSVVVWVLFAGIYAAVTMGPTFNHIIAGIATGFYAGITFVAAMWVLLWIDSKAGPYFNVRFWELI